MNKLILLNVLCCLLFSIVSSNAITYWTGASSSNWDTPENWNPIGVPTSSTQVIIPNVPNAPIISNNPLASVSSMHLLPGSSLTINSGSRLIVSFYSLFGGGPFTTAFFNKGTVINSGEIVIGFTNPSGEYGLLNQGSFSNSSSGTLFILKSTVAGILNNGNGNLTNAGTIQLFPSGGLGGLWNQSDLSNEGSITIVLTTTIGLLNDVQSELDNSGSIQIASSFENLPLSQYGIENRGVFRNTNILQIGVNSATSTGIINRAEGPPFPATPASQLNMDEEENNNDPDTTEFINSGNITLISLLPTMSAINNQALFNNAPCNARIEIISNGIIMTSGTDGVFNNWGLIVENDTGTSNISNNNGIVQNLNGGTFSITSGNPPITTTSPSDACCISPPTINNPVVVQPTCESAGSITIATSMSSQILEYSIDNGSTWQESATFNNLDTGNYQIKTRLQLSPSCEQTYASNPVVLTVSFPGGTPGLWTGCVSNTWHNGNNWGDGQVPTTTTNVVIPNVTNQPIISTSVVANSVHVQAAASLSITSTGTLTLNGFGNFNGFSSAFYNQGTVANEGNIVIGSINSSGQYGLTNQFIFENDGGLIQIDSSTVAGIINNVLGDFVNSGEINIGSISPVGLDGIVNQNLFNNTIGGHIRIDRSTLAGIYNTTEFNNHASLTLGVNSSLMDRGIESQGTFTNQPGGDIQIDNSIRFGILNFTDFNNHASITLGSNSSAGERGLQNQGTFTNQPGGDIQIDNTTKIGILNFTDFNNHAVITLGSNSSVGELGFQNQGTFTNQSGGDIQIDNTTRFGIVNVMDFNNHASITIGANSSVGLRGIDNYGTFANNPCATISCFASVFNTNTFSNSGLFLVSTTQTHPNGSTLTNDGILAFPLGNPIPNISNNEIIISPTNANICQGISPAFGLGNMVDFNILGVFTDEAATLSAGMYDASNNTFNLTADSTGGTEVFYVQIQDGTGNCTRIVPWTLISIPPVAICNDADAVIEGNSATITPEEVALNFISECMDQELTVYPNTFDCSHVDTPQTVTLTISDINGSSSCTATITVLDNTAPIISCPETQTLQLNDNCMVELPDYTGVAIVSDSCGIQGVSQIPSADTILSDAGGLSIKLIVSDVNSNTAECSFIVNKADNTLPTLHCFNQTINFNGENSIILDENNLVEADDNCGIQSISLSPNSISSNQVGQTVMVQVSVTDINNNSSICTSQITIGGLPSGWSQNVNGVGCANGNAIDYNPSTEVWTATSTNCLYGSPFTSDAMGFAQRTLCGNGSITAQVTGISGTSLGWAGVVMRESSAAGAKKAQLTTNMAGNQSRREFRITTNGSAIPQNFAAQNRYWLRVVRSGNQFIMYNSPNGAQWYLVGAQTIAMGNCIEIGLVSTNYTSNSTVISTFANVSYTGSGPMMQSSIAENNNPAATANIQPDFSVYPNPTAGELNIDLNEYIGKKVMIEIYSLEGMLMQMIRVDEVFQNTQNMSLDRYADGMYFVKLKSEGMPDVTKRVVLTKG